MARKITLNLNSPSLLKDQGFIDGKWTAAKSGRTFVVTDPASGTEIGSMPDMDAEDTNAAIKAAEAALPSFRNTTARTRGQMLQRWYQLVMDNIDDLAMLITMENGKPLYEARAEVEYAAHYFEWFAGEAFRLSGETIAATLSDHRIITVREPVGVCGLITPWNWPAGMPTRKIGPAIAAGCTIVMKSPGETPLTAAALAELGTQAGIPPGVVNIVSALENTVQVGAALTSSPIVRKVSFTGSTRVGKLLMKQCADTLKKTSFELGGNAPFIVFDDANLEEAVAGAIACKFRSSGQTCVCANRIYVQKGIYDAFAQAFTKQVNNFVVGRGTDSAVTHGPLIHDRAIAKAKEHTEDAVKHGGKLLTGGNSIPKLGPNFFEPTVIRDMKPNMKLAHEETFGPIAGLFAFDTEAKVVAYANDSEVGLAGYFYSKDMQRCLRVAHALEVGMVGVNTGMVSDAAMPFGGIKESGFGREGSAHGIDEYLTTKAINFGGISTQLQGT